MTSERISFYERASVIILALTYHGPMNFNKLLKEAAKAWKNTREPASDASIKRGVIRALKQLDEIGAIKKNGKFYRLSLRTFFSFPYHRIIEASGINHWRYREHNIINPADLVILYGLGKTFDFAKYSDILVLEFLKSRIEFDRETLSIRPYQYTNIINYDYIVDRLLNKLEESDSYRTEFFKGIYSDFLRNIENIKNERDFIRGLFPSQLISIIQSEENDVDDYIFELLSQRFRMLFMDTIIHHIYLDIFLEKGFTSLFLEYLVTFEIEYRLVTLAANHIEKEYYLEYILKKRPYLVTLNKTELQEHIEQIKENLSFLEKLVELLPKPRNSLGIYNPLLVDKAKNSYGV